MEFAPTRKTPLSTAHVKLALVFCSGVRMFRIVLGSAAILLFAACSPPEAARAGTSSDSDAAVQGLVLDSMTGQAVKAFCVSVDSGSQFHESRDFRNADGRFRWDGLPAWTYSFVVTADGYEPRFVRDVTVPFAMPMQETRFPLQRRRAVRGHVTDAITGVGIERVRIRHPHERESDCKDSHSSTLSDSGGYFVLDGLPRRPIAIEATARNYLTKFVTVSEIVDEYLKIHLLPAAEWPKTVSEDISIAPGETIRDLGKRFGPLADMLAGVSSISGTVSGLMEGEQASVSVGEPPDSYQVGPVRPDGEYEMYGVPTGEKIEVRVHTDKGRSVTDTVDINEGQRAVLDFELAGTARLFGRVTRGGKTTWASVNVWSTMDKSFPNGSAFTTDGDYDIAGLRAGEHLVSINGRRLFRIQLNGETRLDVDLCDDQPPPGTSSPKENVWACNNLSFSGKVVASEDGRGLRNASVTISIIEASKPSKRLEQSGTQTKTDASGAFAVRNILAPGKYLLTVYRAGYGLITRPVLLQESMQDLTVELERSFGQTVRVWGRETGQPLRAVQVEVAEGSLASAEFRLPPGADGAGVLPMSLLGHDLMFTHIGYRPHSVSDWGGEPLILEMSACQLFTEGCDPGPM